MKKSRRPITRSVSATVAPPPSTSTTTSEEEDQSELELTPPIQPTETEHALKKRQSSMNVEDLEKETSGPTNKRQKNNGSEEEEDEEQQEEPTISGMDQESAPEPAQPQPPAETSSSQPTMELVEDTSVAGPSTQRTNVLKRSRSPTEDSDPRKRQAFKPPAVSSSFDDPPATPFFDLKEKLKLGMSKSRSLPTMHTPKEQKKGGRSSIDHAGYEEYTVPLKDDVEDNTKPSVSTKVPSANFTFWIASDEQHAGLAGDAAPTPKDKEKFDFGPAVPSLDPLLQRDEDAPAAPLSRPRSEPADDARSLPPSPTKAVSTSKPGPSRIPVAVRPAAPPSTSAKPMAKNRLTASSPVKPSNSPMSFFDTPGRPPPKSSLRGKLPPIPKLPPSKTSSSKPGPGPSGLKRSATVGGLNSSTNLSKEAQASLANLSDALQRLAMPRPRTSLGDRTSEDDTAVGSSSGSSPEDDVQAKLADLPPRPSTSLGLSSPGGSLYNGNRRTSARITANPRPPIKPTKKAAEATSPKGKGKEKETDTTPESSPAATSEPVEILSDCLKGCVIFVDVKTEEGVDASEMFILMLKQLSAKVIARPGTTATHYVWKSGLQSTLTRWQGLDGEAGKPFLVGIGWVVKCAETKERVDEKKYAVNVKEAEIIFGHKRRRSLQVKNPVPTFGQNAIPPPPKARPSTSGPPPPRPAPATAPTTKKPSTLVKPPAKKQTTLQSFFSKPKPKGPPVSTRLGPVAPPSPVKEVDEVDEVEQTAQDDTEMDIVRPCTPLPPEPDEEEEEEMPLPPPHLLPIVDDPTPTDCAPEPDWDAKPDEPPSAPALKLDSRPSFSKPDPKLASRPDAKPKLPPITLTKPTEKEIDILGGLGDLLAETQSTLLAEAQQEQLDRARKRNAKFIPKVSSPLKRNFKVNDTNEED